MGFGTYAEDVSGGEDGTIQFSTGYLTPPEMIAFQTYSLNVTAAIINNYECYQNPTDSSAPSFTQFTPQAGFPLPRCLFNLKATAIQELYW